MTMHVTCRAVSLDQLEPKKAHGELLKDWQLFLFEYKNSLRPQANSLSCSLGPTLAASTKLMCIFQLDNKKHAERRTLFENGEMAATVPTAALSPPFRALGVSLLCWTTQSANSTFPTGPLLLSQLLQTQQSFLLTKCLRGYFDSEPFLSRLGRQNHSPLGK